MEPSKFPVEGHYGEAFEVGYAADGVNAAGIVGTTAEKLQELINSTYEVDDLFRAMAQVRDVELGGKSGAMWWLPSQTFLMRTEANQMFYQGMLGLVVGGSIVTLGVFLDHDSRIKHLRAHTPIVYCPRRPDLKVCSQPAEEDLSVQRKKDHILYPAEFLRTHGSPKLIGHKVIDVEHPGMLDFVDALGVKNILV